MLVLLLLFLLFDTAENNLISAVEDLVSRHRRQTDDNNGTNARNLAFPTVELTPDYDMHTIPYKPLQVDIAMNLGAILAIGKTYLSQPFLHGAFK